MTKKHFEAIAKILKMAELSETWSIEEYRGGEAVRNRIGELLADYFQVENPNFSPERFNKAIYNRA